MVEILEEYDYIFRENEVINISNWKQFQSDKYTKMQEDNRKRQEKHREKSSEDAFNPVLCGEDENEIYDVPSSLFYHTFTQVLKLENVRHRLSIDRFYYFLLSKLSQGCQKLLGLDIHQRFTPAFMSFIIGAVILILIVVLAV